MRKKNKTNEEGPSITGTVSGNGVANVKITSRYSYEVSKATIKFIDNNTIKWTVAPSDDEHYFPDEAIMKR